MPQDIINAQPTHTSTRAAAHHPHASGIARPAVAQLKINADSFQALLPELSGLPDQVAASNNVVQVLSVPPQKAAPEFDLNKLYYKISKGGLAIPGKEALPAFVGHFVEENKPGEEAYTFPETDWDEFADWLDKKVGKKQVTAGFEFEFSSMADKNPFEGVTHVELSKSEEEINKAPFILETDAGNALELVTPPLYLEAIDSEIPLPKVAEAEKVEALIKARLQEIVSEDSTMKTMADAFKANPGLTFNIQDTKVTAKSLSDRSFGKFTKEHDTVPEQDVANIGIGKITKYGHGGIDTQINIATDAASYAAFIELNMANRDSNKYVRQFYDLQDYLESAINIRHFEEPLKGFLKLFVRNIAGQLAVPSMEKIFKIQQQAFEKGAAEKTQGLEFEFYAWASSGVKDVGNIWIKDNIINIGIGMLNMEAWGQVLALIEGQILQKAIMGFKVPSYLTDAVSEILTESAAEKVIKENRRNVGAYYVEAKKHMTSAVATLGRAISGLKLNVEEPSKVIPTPEVPFMGHVPRYIGPRQDTHVPPDKVQLPAWKQRLHVAEIRSNPIESLAAWTEKAAENKEIKEKQRLKAERFEKEALPYERYNRLLTSEDVGKDNSIKIIPKVADTINLTMTEYETIEKRLSNMQGKQRGEAIKKAGDLVWDNKYIHVSKALANDPAFAVYD